MRILVILSVFLSASGVLCEDDFTNTPVVLWHGMGNEKSAEFDNFPRKSKVSLLTFDLPYFSHSLNFR
jgi:hypothetical protein